MRSIDQYSVKKQINWDKNVIDIHKDHYTIRFYDYQKKDTLKMTL